MLAYSKELHRACSGTNGAGAQNIGYSELFRYLYGVARWRYRDASDDVAQGAVVRVFDAFTQCREPGAFLAFGLQHLLSAARTARRQRERGPASLEPEGEVDAADRGSGDPAAAAITRELRDRFERLVEEFQRRHPRARRQLTALRLKYIDELDDAAICQRLGVPARTLYVLRSRAASKLRAEPEWRALAVEFGILPAEDAAGQVQDPARSLAFGGSSET